MTSPREHSDQRDGVVADLIEYLIVAVPDVDALAAPAAALVGAVNEATIRVLDVVVVVKDDDGVVTALELDSLEGVAPLRALVDAGGLMLSEHDIALASVALRPASVGLVVVTEDRWARPLSTAARSAGGQIVAGERISASRVESLLAEGPHSDQQERDRGQSERIPPSSA